MHVYQKYSIHQNNLLKHAHINGVGVYFHFMTYLSNKYRKADFCVASKPCTKYVP